VGKRKRKRGVVKRAREKERKTERGKEERERKSEGLGKEN
jgi:hypothetical protein